MTYFETHYPVPIDEAVNYFLESIAGLFSKQPETEEKVDAVTEPTVEAVVEEVPVKEETVYVQEEVDEPVVESVKPVERTSMSRKPEFKEIKVHPNRVRYEPREVDWKIDFDTGVPSDIPVNVLEVLQHGEDNDTRTIAGFQKLRDQLIEVYETKDVQSKVNGFKQFTVRASRYCKTHGLSFELRVSVLDDMFRAVQGSARLNLIDLTCQKYLRDMRARKASTVSIVGGFVELYLLIEQQFD